MLDNCCNYADRAATGVDLAITMQQQGLDAKFILLTGDLQESMIDVAMQAGLHEVLQKPVSQEKIKEIFSNT